MVSNISPELQGRLHSVLPLALRAANEAGLTLEDNFLTDDNGYSISAKHADALGDFLAVCIECARQGAYGLPVEFLAARFNDDFVSLVNTARDGVEVAERLLLRHAPPAHIEGEETVSRVRRERWERDHKEPFEQAASTMETWGELLQTPHVNAVYWWARSLFDDLMGEDMVRPFVELMLVQWQLTGLASLDITADAILDEMFKET